MGPNEQNQHFAELRQKICLHIYVVVLLTCLPSLDGKLKRFITKKVAKVIAKLESDDYSYCCSYLIISKHAQNANQGLGQDAETGCPM